MRACFGSLRGWVEGLLGGFGNFAGLDTAGTYLLALRATLRELDPNRLQVGIKPSRRTIISVRHVISELWTFATNFAAFSHYLIEPPGQCARLLRGQLHSAAFGKIKNQDL